MDETIVEDAGQLEKLAEFDKEVGFVMTTPIYIVECCHDNTNINGCHDNTRKTALPLVTQLKYQYTWLS